METVAGTSPSRKRFFAASTDEQLPRFCDQGVEIFDSLRGADTYHFYGLLSRCETF